MWMRGRAASLTATKRLALASPGVDLVAPRLNTRERELRRRVVIPIGLDNDVIMTRVGYAGAAQALVGRLARS